MSITPETAEQHKMDYAVVCCRTEVGKVISADDLEDPVIFPDLEDSGLLTIPENCLKIGEVLGATLKETIDSLTPLSPDLLEGVKAMESAKEEEVVEVEEIQATPAVQTASQPVAMNGNAGVLKIHIGEGKDINLEIPMGYGAGPVAPMAQAPAAQEAQVVEVAKDTEKEEAIVQDKKVRELMKKHYKIDKVEVGPETKIEGTTLYIREDICDDAVKVSDLVVSIKFDIITPDKYNQYSETIMDVQPIATKEGDSKLGTGVTRVLDGVIMMVTGTDEGGVQIGEFGSSEGILEENIMWNRPGAPDKGDIFIKTEVVIKEHTNMERPGPLAAHKVTDFITQEIREALKKLDDESLVVETETIEQYRRPGKKKVVIVKEIMGQGAMHDNLILPVEPVGVLGGKPNVDLGNIPVVLNPLEVLDGGIHALTCIGPASKENSRHYWREPLVLEAMNDPEVDLCAVIFVGSPQINAEKFYVSERLGMIVEALDVEGAFVTTEGFGNNHIDFVSHIEQIGMRGIPVVGMSFCAVQGALVVGNEHVKYMVDHNKSEAGIENEVLCCNTLCPEDALRAMVMLKAAIAGEDIKAPERKWNGNVKENNLELIEKTYEIEIDRVENEQSLPISEKRKEKYS
ncbi:D-proline reductase (dithiol) proprotein PrdA [Irregularibacter muris]|uniref:D-proline reductase (Dithiol) proprotein PrdA n=1 Tax=Irregularibacter muris TaxID=1796619 RepID=A0AAE3L0E6_9FIRM|nr:D-proline reductase (dithiol) proprotein PrdA [Irregularibacter muris]MCR1899792.1 D-proline reductase (dithiol) proprotein PrdA [Irregularibacter muris]